MISLSGKPISPESPPSQPASPQTFEAACSNLAPNESSFFTLPRELRDQVYELLEIKDHTTLARLNQEFNQEAREKIYQLATCHLIFGYQTRLPPAIPIRCLDQILNFNIQINLGRRTGAGLFNVSLSRIFALGGSSIFRKSCTISLDHGRYGWVSSACKRNMEFRALRTLRGFEHLTVWILHEGVSDVVLEGWSEYVRGALEPSLGPAVYHDADDRDRYLEFHPSEHQPEELFDRLGEEMMYVAWKAILG